MVTLEFHSYFDILMKLNFRTTSCHNIINDTETLLIIRQNKK